MWNWLKSTKVEGVLKSLNVLTPMRVEVELLKIKQTVNTCYWFHACNAQVNCKKDLKTPIIKHLCRTHGLRTGKEVLL